MRHPSVVWQAPARESLTKLFIIVLECGDTLRSKWIMILQVATHFNDDLQPGYFYTCYHYSSCDSDFGTVNFNFSRRVYFRETTVLIAYAQKRFNTPMLTYSAGLEVSVLVRDFVCVRTFGYRGAKVLTNLRIGPS